MLETLNPPRIHRIVWHNFVYPPAYLAQHKAFQDIVVAMSDTVDRAERNLLGNPAWVENLVSDGELDAALRASWLLPVVYGHVIERYVESRRFEYPQLRALEYQSEHPFNGRKKVDWCFEWKHITDPADPYHGFEQRIDLTTVGQVPSKHRSYGKTALAVITHEVPDRNDLETFFKVVRSIQRGLMSAEEAIEQMRPVVEGWHETLDALAEVREMRADRGVEPGTPIDGGRRATRRLAAQAHEANLNGRTSLDTLGVR